MEPISLSKSLYNGSRISISAVLTMPSVVKGVKQNSYSINSNPVIFISYNPPKDIKVDRKQCFYKITPRNIYKTIKFFNRAVSWFYDKDLPDLFMLGENNDLIFNSDYKKLMVLTDKEPKNPTNAMKCIPAVITYEDGNIYEGVILYISKPEYAIPLTLYELESILGIISHFSFESITTELLYTYYLAKANNNIQSSDNSYYSSTNQWKL